MKPEPAKSPTPTSVKPVVPAKQPATSGFDLTYLPANVDVVVHVDVAKLRQSKLWETYSKDVRRMIAPGLGDCDFDPLSTATTVDIGVSVDPAPPNVFVIRGVDHHRAMACFNSLKGGGAKQKATFDGEFVTLTSTSGHRRVLTFVDKQTLVMRTMKSPEQGLQQVVQQGAPLEKNKEFVAAMGRANTSAAIVAVSRPNSEALAKEMKQSGTHLALFHGWLNLTDKLEFQYAMDVGSATEASALVQSMKNQFEHSSVKQMFDRIEAHAQDKTVTLDVAMSESKFANMAGMVRGMLPES